MTDPIEDTHLKQLRESYDLAAADLALATYEARTAAMKSAEAAHEAELTRQKVTTCTSKVDKLFQDLAVAEGLVSLAALHFARKAGL